MCGPAAIRSMKLLLVCILASLPVCVVASPSYVSNGYPYSWVSTAGHTTVTNAQFDTTVGCPGVVGDDSLTVPVNIGFTFTYGAVAYTQLRINTNGRLQFANSRCYYGTQSTGPPRTYSDPMPSANVNNTLSLYVVDLDLSQGGTITYATTGTTPNRKFIVTWNNVPQWSAAGSSYNLQVQLYESGEFYYMYGASTNVSGGVTLGPGQVGFQLSPSDYAITSAGLPANNSGLRYAKRTSAASLRITHSAFGIYCLDKAITITPIDSDGNVVTGYVGTINLTTTTGRGTWLLSTGGGVLTDSVPDDGAASYVWQASDTSITLLLRYRAGAASVTANAVDAAVSAIRDDGTQGAMTFTPDGFTVTSSVLSTPPPGTIPAFASPQTAGTNVPVYLTAYGQTPTDATCGIITTYTGAKNLKFWSSYLNPGTGTVPATVNAAVVATAEGSATAQSVAFASGRGSVTLKYKDAGSVALAMKDDTTGSPLLPTGIRGSTGAIVMRPSDLVVSAVTTPALVANPGATTATGAAFVASGAPFRAQVQARDAEGAVTPNFGLESPAEGVRLAATLILPATGRNGTANDGAIGNATTGARTAAGTFTGTTYYWDEVGIVQLRASVADGDYLGSGALTGSLSGNVGRFYPATINLTSGSTVTAACNGFTYMSQPALGAQFTLEGRNAQATRTQNYDATLLGAAAVGSFGIAAENADNGADLSSRVTGLTGAWSAGRVVVDTSALRFARLASADGPFISLRLGVQLVNPLDGLVVTGADMNPASSAACSGAAPCLAKLLGTSSTAVYYGRLALRPGTAAETDPLDVPVFAEYYDGTAYRPLTLDTCTTYVRTQASLGSFTDHLSALDTAVIAPAAATALVLGASTLATPLRLSAPGVGHEGTARVTLDVPAWLEFAWTAGAAVDPFTVILFGHYRGHDRIVYRRERH